jgi:hypothetical protein
MVCLSCVLVDTFILCQEDKHLEGDCLQHEWAWLSMFRLEYNILDVPGQVGLWSCIEWEGALAADGLRADT